MQDGSMKRFLDLVERTGDKVIVTDPAGEHPYVLMSLDQYERLIGAGGKEEAMTPKSEVSAPKPEPQPMKPIQAQSQPIQAEKPAEKPPAAAPKRSAALWRAQLGREAVAEGAFKNIREVVKTAPTRLRTPALAEESGLEPEGEEKFFLEPLE